METWFGLRVGIGLGAGSGEGKRLEPGLGSGFGLGLDQSQPDGDLLGAAVEEDGQQRRARDLVVVAARPSVEPRGVPLRVKVAAE